MKFIQSLIQEKTGLKVDLPDSSGGTTSTGNVARRAFSDETDTSIVFYLPLQFTIDRL